MFALLSKVLPNVLVNVIDEYLGKMVVVHLSTFNSPWKNTPRATTTIYCSLNLWNNFDHIIFSKSSSDHFDQFTCEGIQYRVRNVVVQIKKDWKTIDSFFEKLKFGEKITVTRGNLITAMAAHLLVATDQQKFADLY